MVVIPKVFEVNGRKLRSYKRYSRVTLHIAPDGRAAIVQGVRRRRGWQSFVGTREGAQLFAKLMKVIPKRAQVQVSYIMDQTEALASVNTDQGTYICLMERGQNQLHVRYGAHNARFYGWLQVNAEAPLLQVA